MCFILNEWTMNCEWFCWNCDFFYFMLLIHVGTISHQICMGLLDFKCVILDHNFSYQLNAADIWMEEIKHSLLNNACWSNLLLVWTFYPVLQRFIELWHAMVKVVWQGFDLKLQSSDQKTLTGLSWMPY